MVITKILFTRHEDHKNQVLPPDAHARAIARGKKLKDLGYTIDAVVSSPLPRAVRTALAMLEGHGATPTIEVEPRLGDIKTDKRFGVSGLKDVMAKAKEQRGDDSDASIAKVLISDPEYKRIMKARAFEGAQALQNIAVFNPGKTILTTSHGVARMEIAIRYLQKEDPDAALEILDQLIDRGEVVELTFEVEDGPATFVSAEPLQLLADPSEAPTATDPAEMPTFRGPVDPAVMKTQSSVPVGEKD